MARGTDLYGLADSPAATSHELNSSKGVKRVNKVSGKSRETTYECLAIFEIRQTLHERMN